MILGKDEIRRSLNRVKTAFPNFGDWKHNNEENESYTGFAVWGEYVSEPDDLMPRRFFVTFDTYKTTWKGHLSIGQHSYFWSSADFGDALLLDTEACATLDEAINALKIGIAELFKAFSGPRLD